MAVPQLPQKWRCCFLSAMFLNSRGRVGEEKRKREERGEEGEGGRYVDSIPRDSVLIDVDHGSASDSDFFGGDSHIYGESRRVQ